MDGALVTQKIRGESIGNSSYIPLAGALHVSSKQPRLGQKERNKGEPFLCVLRSKGPLGPGLQKGDFCDQTQR